MQADSLPNDIQNAVCNKEIKIDRNLYSLFWDTGAWYVRCVGYFLENN